MQLTHLGPYEIEKPLGKGGMGSVYAARDTQTGQRVAIKALSPHLAMAEGFRERFEAEIESLKTLRHDGIVRLYGYGEQDGMLFYSMELVDGISLEDELKAGRRFNWREVTSIAIRLSLALKHAHDHGIVHRDIKPANILLSNDEQVKLADFGIARLFGMTQLTTAGGVLGTADYMSPEQAEGRPVTARCDQYSLGGVMYALLAGRPPFLAKNLPQMLQLQRFADPEPVRRYAPDAPEQLERVIMQLLAKDPADRFPNTQVLARHLQALVMALSRPAADDFALAGEQPGSGHDDSSIEHSLVIAPTNAEAVVRPESPGRSVARGELPRGLAAQDAATLAAEDVAHSQPSVGNAPASAVSAAAGAAPRAPERPTRFTTIEEEEERLQAQHRRPLLLIGAQLVGLVSVLAGMGALAVYLSRPPSADELYQTVSEHSGSGEMTLAGVAEEVDEFLERFPGDPRARQVQQVKERIELDELERELRRQARRIDSVNPSLSPAEQLYLRAVDLAKNSPDQAAAMLQSLINLYGPKSPEEKTNKTSATVRLAERRLADLRSDLVKLHERELTALQERLDAAGLVANTDTKQAAAMYQAIIDLHQTDDWAKDVVAEARGKLTELDEE